MKRSGEEVSVFRGQWGKKRVKAAEEEQRVETRFLVEEEVERPREGSNCSIVRSSGASTAGNSEGYKALYEKAEAMNVILKLKINFLNTRCEDLISTQTKLSKGLTDLQLSFQEWWEDMERESAELEDDDEDGVATDGDEESIIPLHGRPVANRATEYGVAHVSLD